MYWCESKPVAFFWIALQELPHFPSGGSDARIWQFGCRCLTLRHPPTLAMSRAANARFGWRTCWAERLPGWRAPKIPVCASRVWPRLCSFGSPTFWATMSSWRDPSRAMWNYCGDMMQSRKLWSCQVMAGSGRTNALGIDWKKRDFDYNIFQRCPLRQPEGHQGCCWDCGCDVVLQAFGADCRLVVFMVPSIL